jgi:exonuclease III
VFAHSDLGEKDGYAGVGLYSKKEPVKVTYGVGNKEFDTEGRVITAEYENFYLVAACKYLLVLTYFYKGLHLLQGCTDPRCQVTVTI